MDIAEAGQAWPLLNGEGFLYGMFVIENINGVHADLLENGTARKINFTLKLKRVDESRSAMFGDLKQQAERIYGNVSSQVSTLAGSIV